MPAKCITLECVCVKWTNLNRNKWAKLTWGNMGNCTNLLFLAIILSILWNKNSGNNNLNTSLLAFDFWLLILLWVDKGKLGCILSSSLFLSCALYFLTIQWPFYFNLSMVQHFANPMSNVYLGFSLVLPNKDAERISLHYLLFYLDLTFLSNHSRWKF